jgi:hypothetical protein
LLSALGSLGFWPIDGGVAAVADQASALARPQLLPLDPLTPDEIALAERVANSDPRVRQELGSGRSQLIRVQFLAPKGFESNGTTAITPPAKTARLASVLFYRYDTDQGISAVVDLTAGTVNDVTVLDGRGVPLAQIEVTQAFALALLDRRVKALLGPHASEFENASAANSGTGQNRVEGHRVLATWPRDPCFKHRCIELQFRGQQGYVTGTSVTVDLSARKVRLKRTIR